MMSTAWLPRQGQRDIVAQIEVNTGSSCQQLTITAGEVTIAIATAQCVHHGGSVTFFLRSISLRVRCKLFRLDGSLVDAVQVADKGCQALATALVVVARLSIQTVLVYFRLQRCAFVSEVRAPRLKCGYG